MVSFIDIFCSFQRNVLIFSFLFKIITTKNTKEKFKSKNVQAPPGAFKKWRFRFEYYFCGSSLFRLGVSHPWMQFNKPIATTKPYLTGFTG